MATVPPITTGTGTSSVSGALDNVEIASNFTTFLQLLTTRSIRSTPINSPSSSSSSRKSSSR
jgi:hypothetical protein